MNTIISGSERIDEIAPDRIQPIEDTNDDERSDQIAHHKLLICDCDHYGPDSGPKSGSDVLLKSR